jgi:hypothetical protein
LVQGKFSVFSFQKVHGKMAQHFANGREQGQFEEERAHVTPVEEGHTHARRTRKHAPRQTQSKQGKQKERKN